MQQNFDIIKRQSTLQWAQKFLTDIKRTQDEGIVHAERVGFGLKWQLIKSKPGFKELDVDMVDYRFQNSQNRMIIIDQEEVIPMQYIKDSVKMEPTPEAIKVLSQLSDNPKHIVLVISRESKALMHQWYAEKAPMLGLAAEDGFFWRWSS